jgi:twinkle protein
MKPKIEFTESEVVSRGACDKCGSSDGNIFYTDGHYHCFVCEAHVNPQDGKGSLKKPNVSQEDKEWTPLEVTYCSFEKSRGITEKTARFFGYGLGKYKGRDCHVAPYFNTKGDLVAQKLRFADKSFMVLGSLKNAMLFGQQKWRDNGRKVVITEGEIDCMSLSQVQDNKWATVSVPNGAAGAYKALSRSYDWLSEFEEIILMFDSDEAGIKAARECSEMFKPSQVKIASLSLKDPNEMLQEGLYKELIDAIWSAKTLRPDGIISGSEMRERLSTRPTIQSWKYPFPLLNQMTLGLREEEMVTITAGSGIGKSQISKEIIYHLQKQGAKVGCICLEESAERTAEILIGMEMGERVHLQANPDRDERYWAAFDATVGLKDSLGNDTLFLYDHWGSTDVENLVKKIRYLVRGSGCNFVLLDHISLIVSGIEEGNERRIIDNLMTTLASTIRELKCGMILVSHLKRPTGTGHENGAVTSLSELRGSAAIGQLSDIVIGCERNQQSEDSTNHTQLRILKNRMTGETGKCGVLLFDQNTGRLTEINETYEKLFDTETGSPF